MHIHQAADERAALDARPSEHQARGLFNTVDADRRSQIERVLCHVGLTPIWSATGDIARPPVALALVDFRDDPAGAARLLVGLSIAETNPAVALIVSGTDQAWLGERFAVRTSEVTSDLELLELVTASLLLPTHPRRPQ
jgi:hypothetical protein